MYSTIFSFALSRASSDLMPFVLVCFGVGILVGTVSLFSDVRNQRRERAAGKKVIWHKRPPFLGSIGGLCIITAEVINVLIINNILPDILFLYILIGFLLICGLCAAIYSLILARRQRKAALDLLRELRSK